MKIQYLGTAAAEGIPAVFCDCDVCKRSREAGGKNIRSRSQAIIDDKILIDFPCDTFYHTALYGIELSKISTCIITHNHQDHLYPEDFLMLKKGFSHPESTKPFTVYATHPGYSQILCTTIPQNLENPDRLVVNKIEPFSPFEADGYKITPLKADHDPKCQPVFYSIEKDGKAILYANDTGLFPEETIKYLKSNPVKYDLISLDCTNMMLGIYYGSHMGLAENIAIREKLISWGCADENTKFVCHHFSHNGGGVTHDDFVPIAKKEGFDVSYDGLTIEV